MRLIESNNSDNWSKERKERYVLGRMFWVGEPDTENDACHAKLQT